MSIKKIKCRQEPSNDRLFYNAMKGRKNMKLMISQPMRGKTTEQIEAERKALVEQLEKEGHEVVNTIFAEETPKDCDTALYYLSKSIEAIGKVDGVVFMQGWNTARGCRIEYQVASEYGKFVRLD